MATYQEPVEEQVQEALRRIPTLQLRRAFFEGLQNPLWVAPLAKQRAFRDPPEPEVMPDGTVRDHYWPEIHYLARVAPEVPKAVVDVLLRLRNSNNPWVRRSVFAIGSTIPADQAARLKRLVEAWISTGVGWRTDPRDMVGFAVNLLQGGQRQAGMWFANHLFKQPKKSQNAKQRGLPLEDFWYEQELPRMVEALGRDALEVVLSWLVANERASGHLRKGGDITFATREVIRQRDELGEGGEQTLVDAVRDLAVDETRRDAERVTSVLLDANMILARRIAFFALAEALRLAAEDEARNPMLMVAAQLLYDQPSLDDSCMIEYGELARAVSRHSLDVRERLDEVLRSGLRIDDQLTAWLANNEDDRSVDERIEEYEEQRWHRWLSAVGMDALSEPLRTKLAELDGRFGIIESPLAPKKIVAMWSGPNSPVSQGEMSVMSPAELVAHLESWHDLGDGWGPEPTHEGQARQISSLLTANPTAVSGVEDLAGRLRPTYLRAILQGWEAASKAEVDLDWPQVIQVLGSVLAHADESDFPVEGGRFEDDVDFRPAKKAAVGLLEELVKKRTDGRVPGDLLPTLIDLLIVQADDEVAWAEYIGGVEASGMDPLTLSLNWQWPVRIRGMIHLITYGPDAAWCELARSSLERDLLRDDVRGASRAALGEGLGRLISTAALWVEPRIPAWFGDENGISPCQQVALTTAMAVHNYHPKLYELLTPAMIAAAMSGAPIAAGWEHGRSEPLQRIGEWMINAIVLGHTSLGSDRLAAVFYGSAPAKIRGAAIGHLAWAFMHAERVEDDILDRLGELWDMRVEHVRSAPDDKDELNGFYWFVKSGKYAPEWWLPRLREALEIAPYLGREQYMIGEEVAASAAVDARVAFDVLKLLVGDREDVSISGFDLTRHAVPAVIARAIASDDIELRQAAQQYMNELGERGDIGLEAEVTQLIERRFAPEGSEES
jgi:hypothetical protein